MIHESKSTSTEISHWCFWAKGDLLKFFFCKKGKKLLFFMYTFKAPKINLDYNNKLTDSTSQEVLKTYRQS